MIGDRLDNDILPANQIGMITIWVKQGLAKYQDVKLGIKHATFAVSELFEIKDILLIYIIVKQEESLWKKKVESRRNFYIYI